MAAPEDDVEDDREHGSFRLAPPPLEQGPEASRLEAEVRARLFGAPPPQMRIGPYEVIRRLGHGGMGTVHLARLRARLFAVKTSARPDPTTLARLRREARALRELDHPHVVRIENAGTYEHGIYVAMEYVEGPTLRQYLRGAAWQDVVRVFVDVGEALAAAHELGIVHRDVKPDNVVVDGTGTAKLVDFGLAKALPGTEAQGHDTLADPLTRTGAALGTVGYAAPEQLMGHPIDARADQFGLCASLYEMLWGRLPFSGATSDAIGLATVAGRIDPPPQTAVPSEIAKAVLRGLARHPAHRHRDVRALLICLRRD